MKEKGSYYKILAFILVAILGISAILITLNVIRSMNGTGSARYSGTGGLGSASYGSGRASYTEPYSAASRAEPFDRLSFSGFLYEKSRAFPSNASISGNVYNGNSFQVTGYFYVIFSKGGRVVHRELVSLGTIGANSSGTWSDLIYSLDYDSVSYEDSTIIKR